MLRPVEISLPLRIGAAVLTAGLIAACARSGAIPQPFPRPSGARTAPALEPAPLQAALVGTALSLRGAPYRNGGSDPSGFDCSGFVSYVFGQQGVFVPRTVGEQYDGGKRVDPDRPRAGDLVFFRTVASGPSHVGIAISGDEFVHAPSSSGVVRVEQLSAPYWAGRFLGIRRFP